MLLNVARAAPRLSKFYMEYRSISANLGIPKDSVHRSNHGASEISATLHSEMSYINRYESVSRGNSAAVPTNRSLLVPGTGIPIQIRKFITFCADTDHIFAT